MTETEPCPECGEAIDPNLAKTTYDDPRTNTGRDVYVCYQCGEQIQGFGGGEFA